MSLWICAEVLRTLTPPPRSLSIRGYACGHQRCLVSDSAAGVQFVTSKELSDHIRTDHAADEFPEHKPYRCGLPGCNKSWKVVFFLSYCLREYRSHITSERKWSTVSLASVRSLISAPLIDVATLTICFSAALRRISYKPSPHSPRRSLLLPTFRRLKHLENRNDPRKLILVLTRTVRRYTNNSAV